MAKSLWHASKYLHPRARKAAVIGFAIVLTVCAAWALPAISSPNIVGKTVILLDYLQLAIFGGLGAAMICIAIDLLAINDRNHFELAQKIRDERGAHDTPDWVNQLDTRNFYLSWNAGLILGGLALLLCCA